MVVYGRLGSSQFNFIYAAINAFDVLCDKCRKEIECESWRFSSSVLADEVDFPFEPHIMSFSLLVLIEFTIFPTKDNIIVT